MAAHVSLPELDQRLLEERSAMVHTLDALRQRVRDDVRALNPQRLAQQQAKLHPGAAIATAVFAGLFAGRLAARLLGVLFG